MTQAKSASRANLAVLFSGLIAGIAGLGLLRWLRPRPQRRPSADELMEMDDSAFEEFIRSTGLRSAADLGVKAGAPD